MGQIPVGAEQVREDGFGGRQIRVEAEISNESRTSVPERPTRSVRMRRAYQKASPGEVLPAVL